MGTKSNPWDVTEVRAHSAGGIGVTLVNHYTGETASWNLDHFSFRDPGFTAIRFTFHRAVWQPGARERFKQVVRNARRLHPEHWRH